MNRLARPIAVEPLRRVYSLIPEEIVNEIARASTFSWIESNLSGFGLLVLSSDKILYLSKKIGDTWYQYERIYQQNLVFSLLWKLDEKLGQVVFTYFGKHKTKK